MIRIAIELSIPQVTGDGSVPYGDPVAFAAAAAAQVPGYLPGVVVHSISVEADA